MSDNVLISKGFPKSMKRVDSYGGFRILGWSWVKDSFRYQSNVAKKPWLDSWPLEQREVTEGETP